VSVSEALTRALSRLVVESDRVRESDALLRYAATPEVESVSVRESEANPTPDSALNGAAEKAEKPNIV
jgi:hypothetical protein